MGILRENQNMWALQKWACPDVTKQFASLSFVARHLPRVSHLVTIDIFASKAEETLKNFHKTSGAD
jgi:hypothetical protein